MPIGQSGNKKIKLIDYQVSIINLGKMDVYLFVSQWYRFELLITMFRLQYCYSLHQAMRSIVYVRLFVAHWLLLLVHFNQEMLLNQLNKAVSSIRFHVNATKYTLAQRKPGRAMQERIKEHNRDVWFAFMQNSQFQNMLMKWASFHMERNQVY